MKKIFTAAALLIAAIANAQTTATNWTATDCNSQSHTLFNDLDNGKIVVMVWVMPCGSCISGATAAYNAAQSFATSNPGKVIYYLADDLGDITCASLTSWITSNSIGSLSNMSVFDNAGNVIKESDFGGSGMPHVVVMGGTDHKIYFNKKAGATNDQAGITTAINSAITATNVNSVNAQNSFTISPNPVTDHIQVQSATAIKKVVITAANGQIIRTVSLAANTYNTSVAMDNVPAGIYMVQLTDAADKVTTQKIIKQ